MRAPSDASEPDDGEAGFVLLSVLLAAVIFMAVGASLAIAARLAAMQTANRIAAAREGALVDGAVLFAADALRPQGLAPSDPAAEPPAEAPMGAAPARARRTALPLPVDGRPVPCAARDGATLEIRVTDQGGLLGLNAAPVPMLEAFFLAARIEPETARRLAEEIADFRDGDDDPQSGGLPESAQYAERGLSPGPRNAEFADPAEIGQLPSATPAIVARLAPLLTVSNARAGLDFAAMDRAAKAELPGDADRLPDLRRWFVPSERTDFAVEVRLRRGDGSLAPGRRALVAFDGGKGASLRIRGWESRLPDDAPTEAPASAALCPQLTSALGID